MAFIGAITMILSNLMLKSNGGDTQIAGFFVIILAAIISIQLNRKNKLSCKIEKENSKKLN